MDRLCALLVEEALARLPSTVPIKVTTPTRVQFTGQTHGVDLATGVCAVSILRSGDILANALQRLAPQVPVGKVLIQRDEKDPLKRPHLVWKKVTHDLRSSLVLVLDPLLATGGTAVMCLDELAAKHGLDSANAVLVCVIAAPEGIAAVHAKHPRCIIITAAIDEGLSAEKYIIPGLGDAGDRYFGVA